MFTGNNPCELTMERTVIMNIKNITLNGEITAVTGIRGNYCCVYNRSADTVYAANKPDVAAQAEDVLPVDVGVSALITVKEGRVWLLGTGKVTLIGSDKPINFIKPSAGNGTSGGVTKTYVDAGDDAVRSRICCRNLLDNPDFRINQRGLAAYHSSGYTVDRWKIVDATWCEPLSGGGMKITASENSSDIPARAVQVVENAAALAGKKCTISCEVLSTTAANSAIYLAMYNSGGKGTYKGKTGLSAGVNQYTADIPADTTAIQVWLIGADTRVGDEAGMYTEFAWAKLETRADATGFEPPEYTAELAKCRMYYQRLNCFNVPVSYFNSLGKAVWSIPFSGMKASPLVSLHDLTVTADFDCGEVEYKSSGVVSTESGGVILIAGGFSVDVSSHITGWNAPLYANGSDNCGIELSCDL